MFQNDARLDEAIGEFLNIESVEEVIKESQSVAKVEDDKDLEEPPKFDIFEFLAK